MILYTDLLFTTSRGALVTLVSSTTIALANYPLMSLRNKLKIAIITTSAFALTIMSSQQTVERIFKTILTEQEGLEMTEAARLGFLVQSIPIIRDNFWIGVGPGNYGGWVATSTESLIHKTYGLELFNLNSIELFFPHLLGEVGIIGLIIYLNIYRTLITRVKVATTIDFNYLKSANHEKRRFCAYISMYTLAMFPLISGVFSLIPETNIIMSLYWFTIAYMICVLRILEMTKTRITRNTITCYYSGNDQNST